LAELASRIVAGIVDYVIIAITAVVLAIIMFVHSKIAGAMIGRFGSGWFGSFFGIMVVMWLLWIVYFTYFEGTSGQTIGKKFVKIKVVKEDGSRCDFGSALIRNIFRIIDYLPFLYLLGIVLIAATGKRKRLGDMLAKTLVVKI
jgi:uncharacterized RDD family membrane protein YckC